MTDPARTDQYNTWLDETPIPPTHIDLKTWAEEFRGVYHIAEALCKTPFVPREMLGKQADVAAAIMKGRELGLDPFDALGSIYIVHGRVGFYAEFMRRRIVQAGHTLNIVEATEHRCIIEGTRKDTGNTHRAQFTSEQARKAGIDLGKYPADKLIARATSRLCTQAFPDVLSGTLIAEDLIDGVIPTNDEGPTPLAISAGTPVTRRRSTTPPKAARTQPKPTPPPDDDDTAELLGDKPEPVRTKGDIARENYGDPASATEAGVPEELFTDPTPAPEPDQDELPLEDKPITPAQLKKLHTLLTKAGLGDRETGLAFLSEAISRHLESSKNLTQNEATHAIDILEDNETNPQ